MDFLTAYRESLRTGKPIKRKTQALYGIIINRLQGTTTTIAKFVSVSNVYNLTLEDIVADDWQIEGRD